MAEVAFVDPVGWLEKTPVVVENDVNDEVPVASLVGLFASLDILLPKVKDDAMLDIPAPFAEFVLEI